MRTAPNSFESDAVYPPKTTYPNLMTDRQEFIAKLYQTVEDFYKTTSRAVVGIAANHAIGVLLANQREPYPASLETCVLNLVHLYESLWQQHMELVNTSLPRPILIKKDSPADTSAEVFGKSDPPGAAEGSSQS